MVILSFGNIINPDCNKIMHVCFLRFYIVFKRPGAIVFCNIALLIFGNFLSSAAQPPTITSFSPGTVCQGNTVTITGTDFTGATSVRLGTTFATNIVVNSPTSITANVANQSLTGTLSVTTPGGTANFSGPLTILPSPIPSLRDVGNIDAPFTNCDGNSVYVLKVSNGSTVLAGNHDYIIDWGDGSAPFTQSNWPANAQTTHTYNSQGYFNIVITLTPPNGCTRTATYNFYNGRNPLAGLTTTNSTTGLCIPAPVEFQISNWSNNSLGTSYQVDFGDGSPRVTLQHPLNQANTIQLLSHTYITSSCPNVDFKATLNAINGCFTTTYTLNQIIIRKKPAPDFKTQLPVPCITAPVCFTNTTISGASGNSCSINSGYLWDFGDGSTSTDVSPCHTYATAGTYNVSLTASNISCGSNVITKPITVSAVSPPPVVSATPITYCRLQAAVPLTATGTGLLWYSFATGGTGISNAPTPSTNTAGTATYYVSQTISSNCESPRVPVTVTVNPAAPSPVISSPIQLCQNQAAVPLTANGTNLLWYATATGGTGSPAAPTPSTATIGSTSYYVSQATSGCESPRAVIVVTVNSLAVAPTVVSPRTYCQNQSVGPLTASGSGLLWYTDPVGGTGNPTAPVPSTASAGTVVYYVSQLTGCGEGPRSSITVNVIASKSATISYGLTNLCNVTDNVSNANPPVSVTQTGDAGGSYSITPATGLSINAASGMLTPSGAIAGTYTIRYTITGSGGCPNFVTTTTISVSGSPTAVVNYPALCSADAATAPVITGTRGGSFSSSAGLILDPATGVITPAGSTAGTYVVTYTILPSSPCPGFTTTSNVTLTQAPSAAIAYSTVNLCNVADNVANPNPPLAAVLTGIQGGSFAITPATGLLLNPMSGTLTPAGATAGIYTISYKVNGTGGCSNFITTINVTVSGTPTASINYAGSPYCRATSTPQAVSISGASGGSYSSAAGLSINPTTGAINPALSSAGSYTVTYNIAASAPCPGFATTTTVVVNDSPVITFPLQEQSICSGGSAIFTPSSTVAGTNYSWSVAGQLPVNVSGPSSGTASAQNPVISLTFTNTGTVREIIRLNVIPVNAAQSGCAGDAYTLTVQVNPVPPAPLADTFKFCMNAPPGILTVNPGTGNTIKWYDQNFITLSTAPVINTAMPSQATYYASRLNSDGCESPKSKMLAIVNPTARIVSASFTNPTSCGKPSGTIVLNVLDLNNNGIPNLPVLVHYDKFQLSLTSASSTDAMGKISIPLTAGTYSNIYVETSGCISQKIPDVFILKDPGSPAQPVAGYNPLLCSGTPLVLTALSAASAQSGSLDYVWAGPAFGRLADTVRNSVITFPSASSADAGTYIVYAIQNNCISATTNFQVEIKPAPSRPTILTRTPLCVGDNLSLQAVSTISGAGLTLNYSWIGPGTGFPASGANAGIRGVKVQDAGIYSITVTSPQTGCSSTTDTLIEIGATPIVKFPQDSLTLPTGYLLTLAPVITNAAEPNTLPIKNYNWSPLQDLACNDAACSAPVATIKNSVCYSVGVTNIYGCVGSDTVCIKVFCQGSQIFIPNAFTPRGNVPENTKLMVRASGISSVKSFRVFNRWGRVVFEKTNFPPNSPDFGWDGTVNGKLADPGVYIYTAEVMCENGAPFFYKGNVTLL